MLLCTAACQQSAPTGILSLSEAWVRAWPPGAGVTAGYGRLGNRGTEPIEIVAFHTEEFAGVSLHETVSENGMNAMRAVPSYVLQPGAELLLAPGGYHLMLMSPMARLAPGDVVHISAVAADGREFPFSLPVEAR